MTAPACSFCGAPSNPRYREILGWTDGTGTQSRVIVNARVPTGRVCCDGCMYDLRHGMQPQSPKLFDPLADTIELDARSLWEREHPHRTIEWHQIQERTRRRYRERVSVKE